MDRFSCSLRLLCALVALVALGGCDKYAEDKAQIALLWDEWDRVNAEHDGEAATQVYSKSSLEWYEKLLPRAMDLPAKQVWDLPPNEMHEILVVRHRGSRKQLKGLDGRGFVRLATSQGWWDSGGDDGIGIRKISVISDWAEAKVYDEAWDEAYRQDRRRGLLGGVVAKPDEYTVKFIREGGQWRIDETSMRPIWDQWIREAAESERMSVRDFLMAIEEENSGEEVTIKVWEPMKK